MFLKLKSLLYKPNKQGSFTEKYLSKPVIKYLDNLTGLDYTYHVVLPEEEMRPDIISQRKYGVSDYADVICKYNYIYNPFSVSRGDLIRLPNKPEKLYINGVNDEIIDKGSIKAAPNFIPKTNKDKNRVAYLASLGTSVVPPNFNLPRESNIKVKDGKLIFGGDVTSITKTNCPTPISRSKVLQKLIEAKIFK